MTNVWSLRMSGNSLECSSTCCSMQPFLHSIILNNLPITWLLPLMGLFYTFTVSTRKWLKPLYRVHCATISFGSAIKAAVRHEYMGNLSSEVLWEQDTTYCTPCLCLLCGRGSRPWMLEPRRQIHPAPSTTISDIPHQSSHIRWPCLLFCVSLSHTVWHGSCSIWYLQLGPAMSLAPEYLSESKDHCRSCTVQSTPKSTGLGLWSHSSYCISCLENISVPVNVCNKLVEQLSPLFSRTIFLCIIPALRQKRRVSEHTWTWESSKICQEEDKTAVLSTRHKDYGEGMSHYPFSTYRTCFFFLIIHLQINLTQHIPTLCIGSWQFTHQSNQTLLRNYQEFNFPSPRLVLIVNQGCVKFIKFEFTYCSVSQPHQTLLVVVSLIARGLYFAFSCMKFPLVSCHSPKMGTWGWFETLNCPTGSWAGN